MNAPSPTVSVIIPSYNHAAYIGECIESILAQTFTDFELIIVDDGSPDDSDRVIRGYTDPRIRYHRQPNGGRPALTRNKGVEMARGKYVTFVDSDDRWRPEKLAKQVEAARLHPEAALICSKAEQFNDDGPMCILPHYRFKRSGQVFPFLLFYNFILTLTVMVRKSVLDEVGSFDPRPEFRAVEDYELWLRIAAKYPIHFIDEVLADYRIHGNNLSAVTGNKFAEFDRLDQVYAKVFSETKVPEILKKKVLAKNQLRRFKQALAVKTAPKTPEEFLQGAIQTDPTNLTAYCLLGLKRTGLLDRVRQWL